MKYNGQPCEYVTTTKSAKKEGAKTQYGLQGGAGDEFCANHLERVVLWPESVR